MKKIFLLLVLLITLPIYAYDDEWVTDDGSWFGITKSGDHDGKKLPAYAEFIKNTNSNFYVGAVTIPSTVSCYGMTANVTSLASNSFAYKDQLTSITIPSTISSIPEACFMGAISLEEVNLPSTIKKIEYGAFQYCEKLTSITLPKELELIDCWSFSSTGLSSLTIPASVTMIAGSAFANDANLESVDIQASLTIIPMEMFMNCHKLKEIRVPNAVTTIEERAFASCSSLNTVYLPASVRYMTNDAFLSPEDVEVDVPDGVHQSHIQNVVIDNANPYFKSVDGVIYSKDGKSLILATSSVKGDFTVPADVERLEQNAFTLCKDLKTVTLQEGVTSCGSFAGCKSLEKVILPNSLSRLCFSTFANCKSLKSINIPPSIKTIEEDLFRYSGLEEIILSDAVEEILQCAFANCYSLKKVIIGTGIKSIGQEAFAYCNNLESIYMNAVESPTFYDEMSTFIDYPTSFIGNITLYVPESSVSSYSSKAPWNSFKQVLPLPAVNIESLSIPMSYIVIYKGESVTIDYNVTPASLKSGVLWASSNESVCTVSDGKISAVSAGTSTITLSPISGDAVPRKCRIKVIDAGQEYEDGDFNGDGNIDVKDITDLVNKVLKK